MDLGHKHIAVDDPIYETAVFFLRNLTVTNVIETRKTF